MTEDAASRWPALLPVDNADATIAAPRVSHAAPRFEVVAACAKCGVRQTFWGTVPEVGAAAEVWQQGHQCAAHPGESGSAALTNGNHVRLPGIS
jgi:hypothetical protein